MTPKLRSPFLDAEVLAPVPPPDTGDAGAASRSPYADPSLRLGAPADATGADDVQPSEAGEPPDRFEHVLAEPKRPPARGEVALRPHLRVEGAGGAPLTDGEYAFHQGGVSERGSLAQGGLAFFGRIDPAQPFRFEVPDRVCLIRAGAFLDPDDPSIEYGGTTHDWTLVRNNQQPERTFWPYYQRALDLAERPQPADTSQGRPVDRLAQHEHITRRPIRIAGASQSPPGGVRISALPAQLRVGPFVRCTDHERAAIWLESVTPCMARVRFRPAGSGTEASRYASTVRVGGRHFAAVEIDGLEPGRFYDYTVELAPLPAAGAVPVEQPELRAAFPWLTPAVAAAMKSQCEPASLQRNAWLTFRTLQRRYDRQLRFATGSCRWYPGDRSRDKTPEQLGPDMLDGLGQWLRGTPKDRWPQFLFFGGDQIYSDEIGEDHARMMAGARFATRVPGPVDPAASPGARLVDGAWAGRFAHRYGAYAAPPVARINAIVDDLGRLDDIKRRYPDIDGIAIEYPDLDPSKALERRHRTLRNRRLQNGAKAEDRDERLAREALERLPRIKQLEIVAEPFRAFLPHWRAATGATGALGATSVIAAGMTPLPAAQRDPFATRYLAHNFLLWKIPNFEEQLPTVSAARLAVGVRTRDGRGHPSADGGRHAADFAEYAYLYERAWTSSRNVRLLLAHVPTFLMLDDHEATDDWNFSTSWVRMVHNRRDDLRMWPKTLTDSLAAYWVYQGWCNKAPSQWRAGDPRVGAMLEAQQKGTDALPALRRCIHAACFQPVPSQDPKAAYQTGLGLEWHYRLPFDPPFLVPDCRTRSRLVPADDDLRVIAHDGAAAERPQSQTIDEAQLAWMRGVLLDARNTLPAAFIAPSTPLMLQRKLMEFMLKPEVAARAWAQGTDVASFAAAVLGSTGLGTATRRLLTVFRRSRDLEHMMRTRSWRDLWGIVDAMRRAGSPVKTLVLVSGDVHHSYCMTATLPGAGRPRPEVLQITSSGLQTTIRASAKTGVAEVLSSGAFRVGAIRLEPGFMARDGTGRPDVALFVNSVALVDVAIGQEVEVAVTYLSGGGPGRVRHVYRYTSGPAYTASGAPGVPGWPK